MWWIGNLSRVTHWLLERDVPLQWWTNQSGRRKLIDGDRIVLFLLSHVNVWPINCTKQEDKEQMIREWKIRCKRKGVQYLKDLSPGFDGGWSKFLPAAAEGAPTGYLTLIRRKRPVSQICHGCSSAALLSYCLNISLSLHKISTFSSLQRIHLSVGMPVALGSDVELWQSSKFWLMAQLWVRIL